jgi:hypothetical protein
MDIQGDLASLLPFKPQAKYLAGWLYLYPSGFLEMHGIFIGEILGIDEVPDIFPHPGPWRSDILGLATACPC